MALTLGFWPQKLNQLLEFELIYVKTKKVSHAENHFLDEENRR
ncbi:hypothetical protein [Algoriphagus mannitolivorans]|nr:hypothetical protein [Algoriphagus mannitolivorans]